MGYQLDFHRLDLDFLKRRILEEDLIPSHLILKEDLDERFTCLHTAGIQTLMELKVQLKNASAIKLLSQASGLEPNYLKLLGRVLGGYQPKPVQLVDFPGTDAACSFALRKIGLSDSISYWNRAHLKAERELLASTVHQPFEKLTVLACLCDLCRIQWVSPLFARLLFEGGYGSVASVSAADPSALVQAIAAANARLLLFKGKIGPRDMGRLVYCAQFLDQELES